MPVTTANVVGQTVDGDVALLSSDVNQYYVGTLTAWTSTGGVHVLSTSYVQGSAFVSDDSQYVVYVDGADLMATGGNGEGRNQLDPTEPARPCW